MRMDGTNGGFRGLRNPEGDIMSYNVYRDGNLVPLLEVQDPGGEAPTVEVTDWALTNEREYSYRIEAVDESGGKSGLSGPVQARPVAGTDWGE